MEYWPNYISDKFLPKFQHCLSDDLGRKPVIFFDKNRIDYGDNFVAALANGLGKSRVMVCFWSKAYWESDWCSAELRLMLKRRDSLSDSRTHWPTLIVAVVIHDSEDIDPMLSDIQLFNLRKYANPWIAPGSLMEQELAEKIKELTRPVAKAIENVPKYDPAWQAHVDAKLRQVFQNATKKPPPPKPSLGIAP
jgi:hypothetical protein